MKIVPANRFKPIVLRFCQWAACEALWARFPAFAFAWTAAGHREASRVILYTSICELRNWRNYFGSQRVLWGIEEERSKKDFGD